MNEEEFKKFVKNVQDFSDNEIVYVLPRRRGFSKDDIETAHFIFWLIYDTELRLKELARGVMTQGRNGDDYEAIKNFVEDSFDELLLSGKIKIIKKNLRRDGSYQQFRELFNVLEKLNNLRNDLFHQKIHVKDLSYNNKLIKLRATKNQIIIDLAEGFS